MYSTQTRIHSLECNRQLDGFKTRTIVVCNLCEMYTGKCEIWLINLIYSNLCTLIKITNIIAKESKKSRLLEKLKVAALGSI